MSQPSVPVDSMFDLLKQLSLAHGLTMPESADDLREFFFTPGGSSYRLIPQPQDGTQAILEIKVTSLEPLLDDTTANIALERLLSSLMKLNAVWQQETDWLISLDGEDMLVLSATLQLTSISTEAVQLLALQGLQRAHFIRELCEGLA